MAAFSLLGPAYLFILAAGLASLTIGLEQAFFPFTGHAGYTAVKIALPVLVVLSAGYRTLASDMPPPVGHLLRPREAPALFEVIDDLALVLSAPPAKEVVITPEPRVCWIGRGRTGLIAWEERSLEIGLPLLLTMSVEHIRALIAATQAQQRPSRGFHDAWLWQSRLFWAILADRTEGRRQRGAFLIDWFVRWYAPRLIELSAPVARRLNLQADRRAAALVGTKQLADALLRQAIVARFLAREFWPAMEAHRTPTAQLPRPFTGLSLLTLGAMTLRRSTIWYHEALAENPPSSLGFPSLAERLAALGELPEPPGVLDAGDASLLLGPALETVVSGVDEIWASSRRSDFDVTEHAARVSR